MKKSRLLKLTCSVFLLCNLNLFADQLIIKFEQPPTNEPTNCGDSWIESEVNMTINTIPDITNCVFYLKDSQFTAAPAQLILDLSTLGEIHQVEIDINDFCAIGCTRALLANQSEVVSEATNQTFLSETLTLTNTNDQSIDKLQVQSREAFFYEIRIEYTPI